MLMSGGEMHDLATRLARGDQSALADLYDACADRLHHYLSVRLGSRDAANDVLQASFVRALNSRRRFRDIDNPVAYMFQIARNEAARSAKHDRQFQTRMLPPEDLFAVSDDQYKQMDDAEVVTKALARLDGDDRELVELKIYGDLTFREIADVLGMNPATVATRYRRALYSLRGWLHKQLQ
jgi:RNA polymerase sigma-70 factor (ECF subfamily)